MSAREQGVSLHGVLAVNKPAGMVSKDVSRRLSRYFGRKNRLGHVGTLDPAAQGVLPLVLGRATRLQDLLLALPKTYVFEMRLGEETDTLDAEGQVCKTAPYEHVTHQALGDAVVALRGLQRQVPPLYSAVKYKGRPLYEYARSGMAHDIEFGALARQVEVYQSELLSFDGRLARVRVRCSKGTYVRVLAQTIATAVASCATVTFLERTESAGIELGQAMSVDELEHRLGHEEPAALLLPIDQLRLGIPRLDLGDSRLVQRLRFGQFLRFRSGTFHYDMICNYLNKLGHDTESSTVLVDENGCAFGLGLATRLGAESVQIVMKRSLV